METKTRNVTATSPKQPGRLLNQDILSAIALLSIGVVSLSQMGTDLRNWVFPRVLTYALLAIAVVAAVRGVRRWAAGGTALDRLRREQVSDVALFVAIAIVYVLAIPWLGFWLPSFAMLVGASLFLSTRRNRRVALVSLAVGAGVCVLAYLMFLRLFFVPLPTGWFGGLGS